jgi:hypothetical protein
MPDRAMPATFVVLASGQLGRRILQIAGEHAEFDAGRRRVVCDGEAGFPDAASLEGRCAGPAIVAVVLNSRGVVCERLDVVKATTEAWIEDAFLRASRELS